MVLSSDAEQFGRTMREYRRRAGLTQQQLADRAGIDRATISLIENAREEPRADTVRCLAQELGINPADFWRELPAPVFVQQRDVVEPDPHTPGSRRRGGSPAVAESSGPYYEPLGDSYPHPGLAELLGDERSRLMLAITPEEEEMLRSIRTRREQPLGKEFFIDVLISFRRHRAGA